MDPTPGPANFVNNLTIDGTGEWWLYVIIVTALFCVGFAVIFVILKASEKPAPTMLVVTIAMLTMITIVGFLLIQDTDLLTLAGVGLGALAGAVSTVFNSRTAPLKEVTDAPSTDEPEGDSPVRPEG